MDEDQFRSVYREINQQRCVFEKAITNRRCDCHQKQRFLLATREGIGCASQTYLTRCEAFLTELRNKSRFALKETCIDGALPHNKELKVQAGGTLALQTLLNPNNTANTVQDIAALLDTAITHYGTDTPYGELIKGVVHYESRPKRRSPTP